METTPLAALVAALAMATPAAPAAPVRQPMVISRSLRAIAQGIQTGELLHPVRPERPRDTYAFPELPPAVLPRDAAALAMDNVLPGEVKRTSMAMDSGFAPAWGLGQSTQGAGGLWFPGYPYLAELTQISEYREPCETIATEMTRKWFEIQSKSGGDKSEQIAEIMAECERLKVRENFYRAALLDCEFGRGQIYLNIADADEQKRQLPLEISPAGVPRGSLKSIQCFEPYWSTPYSWNAMYPERTDFYKPTSWYIMGRKTHSDRILTFIGREVPDLLKPAYNFSGISMIQLGEMSVNMWLRTRTAVNTLINNYSLLILSTDLGATLEEGGEPGSGLIARLQALTAMRNNQGVNAVNKDTEEMKFAEATLAGLDKLQAQSQEHMAAVWGIPLVKLTGITPSGLNASSEGEITVWYDRVGAMQVRILQPNLEIVLKAIQCSIHGKIDDDLVVHWITLDEPTEKELSEIRKSDADMDAGYINAGVISPDEARVRIQSDPDSGYSNLTGPAPEPPQDVDPMTGEPIEPGGESSEEDGPPEADPADEAQKNRDHEADQNELDRKHDLKMAAAKEKAKPAIPIRAKTGK
jgi:phage-related protein (TIGR01555 family)